MNNRVNDGRSVNVVAGQDIAGGELLVIGSIVGVASADIAGGELGAVELAGVFELPKGSGAISQGAPVFVGTDGKVALSGSTFAGIALAAAGAADPIVQVKINFGCPPAAPAAKED